MTFKDFTSTNKVKEYYPKIIINREKFIPSELPKVEVDLFLKNQIEFALKTYKPNESFSDKFLIAPILNFIWSKHVKLNVWTQTYIKADDKLQGRPDYMVSPVDENQYGVLTLPILAMVEAKHENFTLGWGQCLAEMLACQKLDKDDTINIYGIVTTGHYWEFGILNKNKFILDIGNYGIQNLQQTINIVNYIFNCIENEIPKIDLSIVLPEIEENNDENEQYFDEKQEHNMQ
jgi:hypothetical protein